LRFAVLPKEGVLAAAAANGLAPTSAQAASLATASGWDVDNFVRNSRFRNTTAAHRAAAAAYDKAVRALPAQPDPEPDAHSAIVKQGRKALMRRLLAVAPLPSRCWLFNLPHNKCATSQTFALNACIHACDRYRYPCAHAYEPSRTAVRVKMCPVCRNAQFLEGT
jgi:hypothetical protein